MAEATVINCPNCGQAYRMSPENMSRFAGRAMTCKKCQQPFTVPDESHGEAPPQAEPEPQYSAPVQEEQAQPEMAGANDPPNLENVDFGSEPASMPDVDAPIGVAPAIPAQPPTMAAPPPRMPPAPPQVATEPVAAARRYQQPSGGAGDYLSFKKFLTPIIIQVLFWAGAGAAALTGILTMVQGSQLPDLVPGSMRINVIISGLIWLLVGPLVVRALCDVAMAIFQIHDQLKAERGNQQS